MLKNFTYHMLYIAATALALTGRHSAAAELDFNCLSSKDSCSRTFSCPRFERLAHSKALCNIEGIALSATTLASQGWETLVVARGPEPGSWGQCNAGASTATSVGVNYPLPLPLLSQRQLTHGCYDHDTAEWGPGECQVLGKAICQPYLGELRIASLQGMGALESSNDKPVMQGFSRLDKINPSTGETEYYWLVTQANGASLDANAPDAKDYLRFQLRSNAGDVVRTFPAFRYSYWSSQGGNNVYVPKLGHGQSIYVEKNADGSYLVLTEADGVNMNNSQPVSFRSNGNSLLQFRLSADLQSLTFVREVALQGLVANPNKPQEITLSPEVKTFSIYRTGNNYRLALSAVRQDTRTIQTPQMGRYVQIFDLPYTWISSMNSASALDLSNRLSHMFWLSQAQYESNQGIVLTANALLSMSGNSAMPARSHGEKAVAELRGQLALNAMGVNLYSFFSRTANTPSAGDLASFKTLFRYPLSANGATVQRQYLFSDYQELLLNDPALLVDNYTYEPEGLHAVGDEVFFGLLYGARSSAQKTHRIYRMAESFFEIVQ